MPLLVFPLLTHTQFSDCFPFTHCPHCAPLPQPQVAYTPHPPLHTHTTPLPHFSCSSLVILLLVSTFTLLLPHCPCPFIYSSCLATHIVVPFTTFLFYCLPSYPAWLDAWLLLFTLALWTLHLPLYLVPTTPRFLTPLPVITFPWFSYLDLLRFCWFLLPCLTFPHTLGFHPMPFTPLKTPCLPWVVLPRLPGFPCMVLYPCPFTLRCSCCPCHPCTHVPHCTLLVIYRTFQPLAGLVRLLPLPLFCYLVLGYLVGFVPLLTLYLPCLLHRVTRSRLPSLTFTVLVWFCPLPCPLCRTGSVTLPYLVLIPHPTFPFTLPPTYLVLPLFQVTLPFVLYLAPPHPTQLYPLPGLVPTPTLWLVLTPPPLGLDFLLFFTTYTRLLV